MNKYLAGSLIFLTGCGVGYGISYVIHKKIFEEKLEEEALKNQQYYIKLAGYEEPVAKTLSENDDEAQKSEEKQPEEPNLDNPEHFEPRKFNFTEFLVFIMRILIIIRN